MNPENKANTGLALANDVKIIAPILLNIVSEKIIVNAASSKTNSLSGYLFA